MFSNKPVVSSNFVALLAEGVDRNGFFEIAVDFRLLVVALLAEGVDRNRVTLSASTKQQSSPSSRRAWIEIHVFETVSSVGLSPSSRRAWIEI